jgi:SAM-dependent methyltransferase
MAKATRATRRKPKKKPITAKNADRHRLYEMSVQEPDVEVDRISRIFRRRTGRPARDLREDFCGTANLCAEWVRSHPERTAVGIDLDRDTLEWGRWNNMAPLGEDSLRVTLRHQDVRDPVPEKFDVAIAFNFSYQILMERATLRSYFEAVRRTLRPDGILFLDAIGGWEAQMPLEEERRESGFTYVWDQHDFNPIDNTMQCYIHFRFDDGSEMYRAFSYRWRLWQLVELQELLREAGYEAVDVYWEDEDEDRNDLGTFRRRTRVQNDPGWNCYIVAQKKVPQR